MNRPAYPKYKPSGVDWLGEVPEHWEVLPLKRFATLRSGESITSEQIEEGGEYPVFGGNGLRGYTDRYTHEGHYALVGRQGALCGNVNYAQGKFWASEHAVVATPIRPLATFWLGELMRAMNLNQYSVSAAQPGLSVDVVANLRITAPPLSEQRAIADFLDRETGRIDALVGKKRALIARLKEKRAALITRAVTRGLDPAAKLKDSGVEWLGMVPEGWEVKPLKRIVAVPVTDGPHETPEFIDEGVPFVSAEAVSGGSIDFEKIRGYISRQDHERYSLKYSPMLHDIYMVKSGATTGITAIVETEEEFNIWSPLAVIRCGKDADAYFILNFMRSRNFREAIELGWSFGTQQNIGMNVVENIPVALPPLAEQRAIAEYLDRETGTLDRLTASIEAAIERLHEYRAALITAAVTGKIDVREQAAKEAA